MNLFKSFFDPSQPETGEGWRRVVSVTLDVFVALALYAMVVFVFTNAVLRYCFNSGWPISEELSRWLFVWVSVLGAIVAYKQGKHVGVDLVITRLGPGSRRVVFIVGDLLVIAILVILLYGSYKYFLNNYYVPASASRLPTGILSASLLVCSLSMLAISVKKLINDLRTRPQPAAGELTAAEEGND